MRKKKLFALRILGFIFVLLFTFSGVVVVTMVDGRRGEREHVAKSDVNERRDGFLLFKTVVYCSFRTNDWDLPFEVNEGGAVTLLPSADLCIAI